MTDPEMKPDPEAAATEARRTFDYIWQTTLAVLTVERERVLAAGKDCEYIETALQRSRWAFGVLNELASSTGPGPASFAIHRALTELMAGIWISGGGSFSPNAYHANEAKHRLRKVEAGLARGENCKKQADEDWRDKALELAKKIQGDDPAVKPGMLKQKIKNKWPKNGKHFSDRQLAGAIRHWMKTGQLRHWKEKVQSPR